MSGIGTTLEIAKNTLLNTQLLMQTASHNISNADNKTYAKQKGLLTTNVPMQTYAGWLGTGASVDRVVQQRDEFIERSLMSSISGESGASTREAQLDAVAGYLAENADYGISEALGSFWDAWEALNNNPGGTAEKSLVTEAARNLAETLSGTYNNLITYAATVKDEIGVSIEKEANGLLTEIASYNEKIAEAEAVGTQQPANDLRDLRYTALTKLAALLPVRYQEEQNGMITVYAADDVVPTGDAPLVDGKNSVKLSYAENQIAYTDFDGTTRELRPTDGKIGALLDTFQDIGASHDQAFLLNNPNDSSLTYLDRLNALASSIASMVNAKNAGSPVFQQSTSNILEVAPGFQPDDSKALDIAELQHTDIPTLGGSTFQSYLSDIQQRMGMAQQTAGSRAEFQSALRRHLEAQQQSASGVSIDEEMVDILKFQQIYQAAAKIIQNSAQMLDAVIQMV